MCIQLTSVYRFPIMYIGNKTCKLIVVQVMNELAALYL
jgi:hypothetical protein